jgi:hypothetical protein
VKKPQVTAEDFIDFPVATPVNATAMEAERTNPVGSGEPSQYAYTRLLHRLEPTNDVLWLEVKAEVYLTSGVLVLDDTVLDKPYAQKMDLVHHLKETRNPAGTYAFDGCHSSLVNLKKIDAGGGRWLTRLKHNRRVNPDRTRNRPVGNCDNTATGRSGYNWVVTQAKIFQEAVRAFRANPESGPTRQLLKF